MRTTAALRKRERRPRLSVRGAFIGAEAVSRSPLPGSVGRSRNRALRGRRGTGASRRVPRPGSRSVFRLPGFRAHISRWFRSLRWRASQADALQESGGNAAAWGQLDFSMPPTGYAHLRVPQRSRPGPRVLPSPLLLVSEPGPAWIMPLPEHSCAGGMPRGRSVWRCRGLRVPNLGEKQEEFVPRFRELREDGCLRRRPAACATVRLPVRRCPARSVR